MTASIFSLGNLAEAGVRALVMAAAVASTLAVLRVRNVAVQKLAWTLVLAGAIALPFMNPWVKAHDAWLPAALRLDASRLGWVPKGAAPTAAPAQRTAIAETQPDASAAAGASIIGRAEVEPPQPESSAMAPIPATPAEGPHWPRISLVLYAAIALLLLARLAWGAIAALRLWSTATPIVFADMPEFARLRIRTSPRVLSPATIGSGVLLPGDCNLWDAGKLRTVLAHESAHVRQFDFYLQFCAELYAAVLWFSPLGWWLRHKLCALGETLSDGAAVKEAASRATYAQILLDFAATPRTNTIGVAMARPALIATRIDQLLDESRFRQAFAASPFRKFMAGMLVPAAMCAAAALFQVSAKASSQQPAGDAAAISGPQTAAGQDQSPAQPTAPPQAAPPQAGQAPVAPPPPAVAEPMPPSAVPPPTAPPSADDATTPQISSDLQSIGEADAHEHALQNFGAYTHERDGEFYGLFERDGGNPHFSGTWLNGHAEALEKAQKQAHGDFLLFTDRSGKSYYIDDPDLVFSVDAPYRAMRDLSRHSADFSEAAESLARAQVELDTHKTLTIDKGVLQKELSQLDAVIAKLQSGQVKTLSQAQIAELQSKLGHLEGRLAMLQTNTHFDEINMNLAKKMAEVGKQQGQLGWRESEMSRDAETRMHSAIEQALKDGKAKPLQ